MNQSSGRSSRVTQNKRRQQNDSDFNVTTLDIPTMPLDVFRLRNSNLACLSSGDEFKAAILLWCAAWQQTPPGSLPNDDKLLEAFSMSPNWEAVKEKALHGFIIGEDGRLHHHVIAEFAGIAIKERIQLLRRRRQQSAWMSKSRRSSKAGSGS